jgi:hypothetical protein
MTCRSEEYSAAAGGKRLFTQPHDYSALRAKLKFEADVFFLILRSKIRKNTSASK